MVCRRAHFTGLSSPGKKTRTPGIFLKVADKHRRYKSSGVASVGVGVDDGSHAGNHGRGQSAEVTHVIHGRMRVGSTVMNVIEDGAPIVRCA